MKKFFMSAVMAIVTLAASAQQQETGTFSIMPRVGMGYTNVSNMDQEVSNNGNLEKESFGDYVNHLVGVEAKYQVNKLLGVSLGVDYNHFGVLKSASSEGGLKTYNYDYSYSTLAIPVLAQFNIGNHFGAKCGIQPAFLLTAKENSDKDMKDKCKSMLWTIPVGISWTFNSPLVLDLRYNIPLSRVNKVDIKDNRVMNTINLTLGYRFDL